MSLKQVLCKIGTIQGNTLMLHYQQSVGYKDRKYDNYVQLELAAK
jgi:hypothetical protein